ncbi:MOB kinase activator 1B isoform X2 [Gallus gallus]|uniref:MOB kinase activator 1B isoform X2 n=1 Tax=Gallus gallus TaxID=9031 RepID=UPI001F0138A8|nr:MOB kinase activator 1B isoform X2 [Gallus gallus]
MQKQRFSSSFHERSRYLRAQGAEPHRGVVRIMPPTDLLREPRWHTQCYRGTVVPPETPATANGSRSSKTFKPKKNIPEGSHQYELLKHAEATLGSGNLRMAVMLPEGEDLNEWVAVNTVDFFNQINMLYGTITDFCTEESCPVMSAGPKYEYHWADGTNIKKPIKCSAPKYIDYLMTWVQDQLDDETLFPSKIGVPFPKNFMSVAKTILKRLFRVYAHIYHQHFDPVIQLQEEAHLNTSFKHFIFFVQEFNLIDRRELAPLQELIEKLTSKDR